MSFPKLNRASELKIQTVEITTDVGIVAKIGGLTKHAFYWISKSSLDATLEEAGVVYSCVETIFNEADVVFTFSLPAGRKVFVTLTKDNVIIVKGNPACKDVASPFIFGKHSLKLTLKAPQIKIADWVPEDETLVILKDTADKSYVNTFVPFSWLLEKGLNPHICPVLIEHHEDTGYTNRHEGGSWIRISDTLTMIPLYTEKFDIVYLFADMEKEEFYVRFTDRAFVLSRMPSVTLQFERMKPNDTSWKFHD